ncbi:hypothetical protein JCM21900_003489 [Sporobolomyces salmonicolor]
MFPRAPTGLPRVPEHLLKAEQQPPPAGPPPDLSRVLLKLALFTLAMVLGPIGTYYATRDWYFGSNLTGAALSAVTVANAILVGFVYMAFREDRDEQERSDTLKEQTGKKE